MDTPLEHPAGTVIVARSGGYFVRSSTTPGAYWLVHGATCTCPAGRAGAERCRHRSAVARFVAEENRRHARPAAPPNIGALCD